MAKQAVRKRLVRLAYECGFEGFPMAEVGDGILPFIELLGTIPDEELGEFEAALKDLQGLQASLRSLN